jgi:hypothetical protein
VLLVPSQTTTRAQLFQEGIVFLDALHINLTGVKTPKDHPNLSTVSVCGEAKSEFI